MFRFIADSGQIDLTVLFLSDMSLREYHDPGFQTAVRWDVPLLEGYRHLFLPALGGRQRLSFLQPLTYGVRRCLAAGGFDALWIHGYMHHALLAAIGWARALGLRVLLRGESNCLCEPASAPRRRLKRLLLPRLFRMIDGFLTIGALNRDYYLRHGVPAERMFAMPYAVDNDFFRRGCLQAARSRSRLRTELELAPGRPVILYASKLQARKRPADLLEAYARLSPDGRREPHPYLLFIGDGEQSVALRTRAQALGWNSIRFAGFRNQTDLPAFYDLCDVFVLPAASEPWGLVINEVLNAAKPVVVSDQVGCYPDLVADGGNGFIVPLGDIGGLSRRLGELCANPSLAATMGQEGRRKVAAFSFAADLEGLMAALRA